MSDREIVAIVALLVGLLVIELADRWAARKSAKVTQALERAKARLLELEGAEKERVYESAARALHRQRTEGPRRSEA